jgi:signal transduction histidine kinase
MAMAYRIGLVLERARADALLRRAQERLLQAEKLALAGKLAGSMAHEVNNPLACVRANLESLRLYLPAIQGTLRAAREAAGFLAGVSDPAGPALGRSLVQAMGPLAGDAAGELSEIAGDTLEAAQRIGQLVASFMRLSSTDLTLEPEAHDVRATIASCVAELPPDTGRPALRHDPGEGLPVIAWIAPDVLQAALTGLLRFLLAPGLHRTDRGGEVVVRAERCPEGACLVLSDATLSLSEEQRRSILDPRMDIQPPGGSTVRLGLVATLSHQLLRGCGAELSIEDHRPEGLELRIRLPAAPVGAAAP